MITSVQNERVKHVVALSQKARLREEEDVFLAEGIRLCEELPEDRIREMYLTEDAVRTLKERGRGEAVERLLQGGRAELVSDAVMAKMSDVVTPQGALAIAWRRHYTWDSLLSRTAAGMGEGADQASCAPLLLLLEDIRDPGNLGTILRTAEAAGVTGVVLVGDTVDVYAPKAVRSTMGAVNRVPFLCAPEMAPCIQRLRAAGVRVHAAALDARTESYTDADYRVGTAFMIGNEANGLRPESIEAADDTIYIPMQGRTESLNAAISAAVLVFEASRQRQGA